MTPGCSRRCARHAWRLHRRAGGSPSSPLPASGGRPRIGVVDDAAGRDILRALRPQRHRRAWIPDRARRPPTTSVSSIRPNRISSARFIRKATCGTAWSRCRSNRTSCSTARKAAACQRAVAGPDRRSRRATLAAALADNARPENAYYRYQYFDDNCSTRVRDALDAALGGGLRRADRRPVARHHLPQRSACAWRRRRRGCGLVFDVGLGPYDRQADAGAGASRMCRCGWPTALREVKNPHGRPLVQEEQHAAAAPHRRPNRRTARCRWWPWALAGLAIGRCGQRWLGRRAARAWSRSRRCRFWTRAGPARRADAVRLGRHAATTTCWANRQPAAVQPAVPGCCWPGGWRALRGREPGRWCSRWLIRPGRGVRGGGVVRVLAAGVSAAQRALDRAAGCRSSSGCWAGVPQSRPTAPGHAGLPQRSRAGRIRGHERDIRRPMPAMRDQLRGVRTAAATRREIGLDAISDVLAIDDGSFVWVGLYEPDDGILEKLQEEFCLHDLAVEDAQQRAPAPEDRDLRQLAVHRRAHRAERWTASIRFGETHMFVGPRYLVTVRHGASISYAPARARVRARTPTCWRTAPARRCTRCWTSSSTTIMPIVDEFSLDLNELEQDIFAEEFRSETVKRPVRPQARTDPPAHGGRRRCRTSSASSRVRAPA